MPRIIQGNNPQLINEKDIISFFSLWKKNEENPFLYYLVSIENEKIIGYILYTKIYERIEIEQFFVHEDYQNQKVGTTLLKQLIAYAEENHVENITLEVNESNEKAIHLYKKLGFQKVARRKNYYHEKDGILMEKRF